MTKQPILYTTTETVVAYYLQVFPVLVGYLALDTFLM